MILTRPKAVELQSAIKLNLCSESRIFCNEIQIQQIIINLVSNALDAVKNLEEKWVELTLKDLSTEVALQVIDSGNGVNEALADKIFQPFFTTKPVGEGTGLGLSITKGIVEQHGGNISLHTIEGHTCFEVRLPISK